MVEQVLAPGAGLLEDPSVDRRGAVDEPALRARTHHRGTANPALMQARKPVQRVPFWHRYAGAPGTGGGTWGRSYSARMSMRRWCRSALDHSALRKARMI